MTILAVSYQIHRLSLYMCAQIILPNQLFLKTMKRISSRTELGNNAPVTWNPAADSSSSLPQQSTRTSNGMSKSSATIPVPSLQLSLSANKSSEAPPSQHSATPQAAFESVESQSDVPSNDIRGPQLIPRSRWLDPHAMEYQKRAWHYSSLGMGTKHVQDEWGFSSTSVSRVVSRSHSPSVDGGKGED